MISFYLHEQGAGGVAIEESGSLNRPRDTSLGQWYEAPLNHIPEGEAIIQAYYPDEPTASKVVAGLQQLLAELRTYPIDVGRADIAVKVVKEEDWENAWKQYYKPVAVTENLVIKPTWEPYEAKPGQLILELDPGMAFGTGTHATTSLCLRTLEERITPGMKVIDVGTGSGILAIAAAKLGASRVLALDLDPVAVSSAKENVRLNKLDDRIEIMQSDLLAVLRTQDRMMLPHAAVPADLVVANILAEIILQFIDDVYASLAPGGIYVVSGVIEKKQAEVQEALLRAGFLVEGTEREQDWVVLTARKPIAAS